MIIIGTDFYAYLVNVLFFFYSLFIWNASFVWIYFSIDTLVRPSEKEWLESLEQVSYLSS